MALWNHKNSQQSVFASRFNYDINFSTLICEFYADAAVIIFHDVWYLIKD